MSEVCQDLHNYNNDNNDNIIVAIEIVFNSD